MRSPGHTPRHSIHRLLLATLPLVLLACSGDAPVTDEADALQAGVMEQSLFDTALFDSIGWVSDREARSRGATVYSYSCAKCHGPKGAGDGGYRHEGRLVRPPSFLALDWRFAEDRAGLRAAIHGGSEGRMPHWGRAGLTPRDIDAVAEYIRDELWAKAY